MCGRGRPASTNSTICVIPRVRDLDFRATAKPTGHRVPPAAAATPPHSYTSSGLTGSLACRRCSRQRRIAQRDQVSISFVPSCSSVLLIASKRMGNVDPSAPISGTTASR